MDENQTPMPGADMPVEPEMTPEPVAAPAEEPMAPMPAEGGEEAAA